jgi:AcrR family transcriptional regulator
VPNERSGDTQARIIDAARSRLLADGYANLSTRRVAEAAGVPLSQIHYHFGGKQGLVLSLLANENRRLVDRQRGMYASGAPLWKRYEQACDFLDEDVASGYVRVLQEMIAVAWSDRAIAGEILALLQSWLDVLEGIAREAEERFGSLGPFTPGDVALLTGLAFLGAEAVILLGDEGRSRQIRASLRSVGKLIRMFEEPEYRPGRT